MSQIYQPLHHKYRPERFDDLIGQESIASTLKQALISKRIAPAYLFSGPRGTGKTSSARILARSLNCLSSQQPTTTPCGNCETCKTISLGTSLDVIEIDAASNTGVDNIRELIERSRFAPVQARWKVYVVDECHMLSTAAFNALLKTLEEPPTQVVFVLATTDPQRVLPTIRSRCQCFDFRRIPLNALSKHLTMIADREEISIDPDALHLIAQRAQGGLRDAESMLDQLSLLPPPIKISSVWDLIGAVPEEELLEIVNAMASKQPIKLLETSRNLLNQGREPLQILQGLVSILRDLVLIKAAPERIDLINLSNESHQKLIDLANILNLDMLLSWQTKLKGTEYQLRQSVQPHLWLEVLLLGFLSTSKDNSVNAQQKKEPAKNLAKSMNARTEKLAPSNERVNNSTNIDSIKESPAKNQKNEKEIAIKNENLNSDLIELWQQILGRLELPSTRMLLSQQAKLVRLTSDKAFIEVTSNWIGMVQSRIGLIEEAVSKTLGTPKTLILESKVEKGIIEPKDKKLNDVRESDTSNIMQDVYSQTDELNSRGSSNIKHKKESFSEASTLNNEIKSQEDIENKAQNLANFFNGKVLDIDIEN